MLQTSRMASKHELEKEVRVDEVYVFHNSFEVCKTHQLLNFYLDFKIKQAENQNKQLSWT